MEVRAFPRQFGPFRRLALPCALAVVLSSSRIAAGQDQLHSTADTWREPMLPGYLNAAQVRCTPLGDSGSSCNHDCPVRLFRMTTGYLVNPLGIDEGDSSAPPSAPTIPGDSDPLGKVQVSAGNDNPYLDFRRPGDPGGVGYFRVESQVQVVESGRTGCTLGLRAATPAGMEYDGLSDGPTVVAPNLGWYYDLGDGAAIHGFVGKNVRAGGGWTDNLGRDVEYGLAIHRPMPTLDGGDNRNLFMFLQALGRHRPEVLGDPRKSALYELLPGLHWRVRETWWLSGGVIVPVGTSHSDLGLWQITCSWQF